MDKNQWLIDFIKESNHIEGIHREPTGAEMEAVQAFLDLQAIEIPHLEELVRTITTSPQGGGPGHRIRNQPGLDVMVGGNLMPLGGPDIIPHLNNILYEVHNGKHPYIAHRRYENLHPFTDGNGRSGRVLWLWQMQRVGRLQEVRWRGFLHNWYYDSLNT